MITDDYKGEKGKQALARVLRRFKQAEDFRAPLDLKVLEYWKLYRNYVETKDRDSGRANLFIPETFSHIETIAPRIVQAAFASRPFVGVLPRPVHGLAQPELEVAEARARALEKLMDYQMADRMRLRSKASAWVRDLLLTGIGPAKVVWRHEVRKVKRRVPDEGNPLAGMARKLFGAVLQWTAKEQTEVVYDDPEFYPIDFFDFFYDPQGKDIDSCRYVIMRSRVTKDYLKQMKELGVYDDIDDLPGLDPGIYEDNKATRLAVMGLENMDSDEQEKDIELLEYWEDDELITLANRARVIRGEPNPLWLKRKPFLAGHVIPDSTKLNGISLVEAIESLQYELNDTRNQRMDAATMGLNRMWKVRRTSELTEEDLRSRPNGVVFVEDMDDIAEIQMSDVKTSGYQEEQIIRDDMQKATGAYDIMRGASAGDRTTATEVSTRAEMGSFKFKDMLMNFEESALVRLAELVSGLDQQFVDQNRLVRIVGPDGMTWEQVTPADVQGQFDFQMLGSAVEPIVNKDTRRQELIQLYQALGADPLVNRAELLKLLIGSFDVPSPERMVMMPQPAPPEQGGMVGPDGMPVQGGGLPPELEAMLSAQAGGGGVPAPEGQ